MVMMQRQCAIRILFEEFCGYTSKREEIVAFMGCTSECVPQTCPILLLLFVVVDASKINHRV